MSVTTSYPGVYIQELPNLNHSITPASTSVAVFIGYTHPFLTPASNYLTAIQLFSVADYQNNFGGFFSFGTVLTDYVGQAVYQFFNNGGANCYVVGLPATAYHDPSAAAGAAPVSVAAATAALTGLPGGGITFTALQPVDVATASIGAIPMSVTISNPQTSNGTDDDAADIVIGYGNAVETYRQVPIADLESTLAASRLADATVGGATAYPSVTTTTEFAYATPPQPDWTIMNPVDFAQVFAAGGSLDKVVSFNLLATPGVSDPSVTSAAAAYCERKRAFLILDTPAPETANWGASGSQISFDANALVADAGNLSDNFPVSVNAALYYPWLQTTDLVTGASIAAPPSGFVAGMYGREDSLRGVWKSPAGIETALNGTTGVDTTGLINDDQQGVLNQYALNCIRQFPGVGTVIFGARTTAGATLNTGQQQWRYVAVRRMALFIEQTLYQNLKWAVFEPNSQPLWDALKQEIGAFMLSLFRLGAFAGTTPSTSFVVACDSTTTTPDDVANGVVNILVGFAPLVPAEFVVVQIAQLAGQAQS